MLFALSIMEVVMSLPTLSHFSNEELFARIKSLKGDENRIVAEVVLHLHEIDSRGIYRDAGYSSLFVYCRDALGYSEGAAYRRARAARCLRGSPEIYQRIAEGKLSLSALSEVAGVINEKNSEAVLSLAEGASKRTASEIAVQFGASKAPKRETIRMRKVEQKPVTGGLFASVGVTEKPAVEERYSFSFEVSKEVAGLYEEARALIGPCAAAEVFEKALREYVAKRKTVRPRATSPAKSAGRAIPKSVRRSVFERDHERCTYVSPDGVRCSECVGLEIDHIVPFARGGSGEKENLRLLCRAHNQLAAEQWLGKEFMAAKRGASYSKKISP